MYFIIVHYIKIVKIMDVQYFYPGEKNGLSGRLVEQAKFCYFRFFIQYGLVKSITFSVVYQFVSCST